MNIFLFVVYYLPSIKSSAKLMNDLAIELLDKGHDVTVITLSENITKNFVIQKINNVRVIQVKTGKISSSKNIISRGINEFLISYKIWKYCRFYFNKTSCDLLIWYSPSIFFGRIINKLKKKYNAKSYLILRDIFPKWALDTGNIKKGILYYFLKYIELYQYKQADVIGVQSPSNLKYFKEIGLYEKIKIEVLYNWTKTYSKGTNNVSYREKLNLNRKIVFFYGGNFGVAQDIDNILRLSENLKNHSKAHFLLVGDGSEYNRISLIIKSKNLFNVTLHKSVNQFEYLSMLSEFDIGLISLDKKFKTSNFPGKMLGYMEFFIPMLLSINTGNDLKNLIEKSQSGFVSVNGDDDEFKKNALLLLNNKIIRKEMGINSNKLLREKFSSEIAAKQILSH